MKKNYSAEKQTNKTHQDAFYQLCTLRLFATSGKPKMTTPERQDVEKKSTKAYP